MVRELSDHRGHGSMVGSMVVGGRWLVRCRHMKGYWYRWRSAEKVFLITFFSIALCSVVFGVRSEYVDVVQMLIFLEC